MIKAKAIRKIFITTMTMFILLTVFSISRVNSDDNSLRVNMEVVDTGSVLTHNIYLLNDSGYLVRSKILLVENTVETRVLKVLNSLIETDTSKFSNGLRGTIPAGTKVISVISGSNLITVDFSKEILNVDVAYEKQMLSSIVYSILEVAEVDGVSILVEGKNLEMYPNTKEKLPLVLTKQIGINKQYDITSRDNISSIVVYYLDDIDDALYYVPVTKYVNDDREKIKIIIEELTTSYIYEDNLMSFLNNKAKLVDYKEENDILFLNFNEYLFENDDKVLEEVIYSVGYSVFDNYDVSMVIFEVNGEEVGHISRN